MGNSAAQRSIVVADSDELVINMLRRNLENSGITVQEATTGLECIRRVLDSGVALVIMDTGLRDLSPQGILCLLRLTEATARVPVILMAAEPPERARKGHSQPDDFIQKPFDMRDLLARVERYVGPLQSPLRTGRVKGGV